MQVTEKLIAGYQRFKEGYYQKNSEYLSKLARLGQSPKVALVSCCDSRVEPSTILDCEPGDLFVVRNVANVVPPCEDDYSFHGTSAALEFAVNGLKVESIVVLGHASCGGIKALIDNPFDPKEHSFINTWMKQLESIRHDVINDKSLLNQEQRYLACEQQSIAYSVKNLLSFPWIKERVENKSLSLHGWYYDINNAELFAMQSDNTTFKKIV